MHLVYEQARTITSPERSLVAIRSNTGRTEACRWLEMQPRVSLGTELLGSRIWTAEQLVLSLLAAWRDDERHHAVQTVRCSRATRGLLDALGIQQLDGQVEWVNMWPRCVIAGVAFAGAFLYPAPLDTVGDRAAPKRRLFARIPPDEVFAIPG